MDWILHKLFDVELYRIGVFFVIVLMALVIGRLSRYALKRRASRHQEAGRGFHGMSMSVLARAVIPLSIAIGVRFGVDVLDIAPEGTGLAGLISTIVDVVVSASIGYSVYCLVDIVDYQLGRLAERTETKVDDMLVPLVGKSVRITILVLIVVQVSQALSDKPMTSILAGLGVGGLALALAGQDIIKNFFGSLVILTDRPFEVGDRIKVGDHDGPVESVGFRSTKLRTLAGHLVTVPNSEVMNTAVENIGKRPYIKRVANITVTYDTSPEKVQQGIDIILEILADHEGMDSERPPLAFFNEFNDVSLNILVIYWYHNPDFVEYLTFTDRVNFQILKRFNDEGIEFAFPTQTVFLANDDKRQLAVKMLDGASSPTGDG